MSKRWAAILGVGAAMAGSAVAPPAQACGGFFCSQTQTVNQAAERIVFAHNDDGTVTAVIEILYQGPSESFSWLLPISSVPQGSQIAVASKQSFDRLQAATNPQYFLNTRVEGTCDQEPFDEDEGLGAGGDSASAEGGAPGAGVSVEASGVVGAFEWTAISVDPSLPQPADAAVAWLEGNGYDVPEGSPGLLGPYLEDGLYLLALRLQKGRDSGSIRPIALTYDATRPMIPIKLTSVAANENMGVMTWILADDRAVPQNYYDLELNEARINWFNPNQSYNSVVIAAADEAGGQGFVTEYAQPTGLLTNTMWSQFEEEEWTSLRDSGLVDSTYLALDATWLYGSLDGYWDVFAEHVTLPDGVTIEDVQNCPDCYEPLQTVASEFLAALESDVIAPARLVQQLFDAHPFVTRLYTTMSAEEMTVDPLFTFNPDLDVVSNVHDAERVIECGPGYYFDTAPWRIELPQGGVIRGGPGQFGFWPEELQELPANLRIRKQGESGEGKVLEDNSSMIDDAIETYNATVDVPPPLTGAGGAPGVNPPDRPPVGGPDDPRAPNAADPNDPNDDSYTPGGGCGCRVARGRPLFGQVLMVAATMFWLGRRRRRRQT